MTKLGFTKLGLKPNSNVQNIKINEQIVEIKQYLPVEEKLALIGAVMEAAHDQYNFSNPYKIQVYATIAIIEEYTNISFTDKQKENIPKLYDLLVSNNVAQKIIASIPEEEYNTLMNNLYDTIKSFYAYQTSALGIFDSINQDYSSLDFDATEIQKKIGDPDNLEFLKSIMAQLG